MRDIFDYIQVWIIMRIWRLFVEPIMEIKDKDLTVVVYGPKWFSRTEKALARASLIPIPYQSLTMDPVRDKAGMFICINGALRRRPIKEQEAACYQALGEIYLESDMPELDKQLQQDQYAIGVGCGDALLQLIAYNLSVLKTQMKYPDPRKLACLQARLDACQKSMLRELSLFDFG